VGWTATDPNSSEFVSPPLKLLSTLGVCSAIRFPQLSKERFGGEAGRLFDDLTLRFGSESVFMDVSAIEPGRDFRKAIDQSVATCSVLLAMIGQEWLDMKDSRGLRRLDDPNDFVRIELASALRRDIPVVPVLVRGAKMPLAEQLPDDLKELAYRNAVELTHARWKSDVEVLLHALRPYLDVRDAGATSAHTKTKKAPTPGSSPATSVAVFNIEPQTMERIRKELAAYIGPISEVVVKRAAKRCSSLEDLYRITAQEIEAETDRAKFLQSCRS
jgi:TIR domain